MRQAVNLLMAIGSAGLLACTASDDSAPEAQTPGNDLVSTEFDGATTHSRFVGGSIESIITATPDAHSVAFMRIELSTLAVEFDANGTYVAPRLPELSATPTLEEANAIAFDLWQQSQKTDVAYGDCGPSDWYHQECNEAWTMDGCKVQYETCCMLCDEGNWKFDCFNRGAFCDSFYSFSCFFECLL